MKLGKASHLLPVSGCRLAKLARLPHDGVILGVCVLMAGTLTLTGRVGGSAKVLEAGALGELVESLARLLVVGVALASQSRRQGGQEEQRRRPGEMHLDESDTRNERRVPG